MVSESLNVEELDPRDDNDRESLVEELIPMVPNDQLPDQVIYIGSILNPELCEGLIQFLKKNQDVFV